MLLDGMCNSVVNHVCLIFVVEVLVTLALKYGFYTHVACC